MKALVTGGAGFIGSHVVDRLIEDGHEVLVIDDLSGGFRENVNPKAKFFKVDIRDYKILELCFASFHPDYVYHLAAYAAEGLSSHIKRHNYEVNLMGSINLINLSIVYEVKRFIFASSIAVYGSPKAGYSFSEEFTPKPEDSYGIAKYMVEQELINSGRRHGLEYTIFRLHNVYGERQNIWDKYRNVVGIFINKALAGEPLPIFGTGSQMRQFTYIQDIDYLVAEGYMHKPNEIYNLGTDCTYSILDLAHEVLRALDRPRLIHHLRERDEVQVACENHLKFPLPKQTPLEIGVDLMITWALENPLPPKKLYPPEVEVQQGLPEAWKR